MKQFMLFSLLLLSMAIIIACGSSGSTGTVGSTKTNATVQRQSVQVTLVEYKITSSTTTFHVGVPYHFVVTNKGTIPHEFMVMPPMSDNMSMASMDSAALVFIPILSPGQTSTIDYTFTKPDAHLEIACHFSGRQASDSHYALGMHLSIIVE